MKFIWGWGHSALAVPFQEMVWWVNLLVIFVGVEDIWSVSLLYISTCKALSLFSYLIVNVVLKHCIGNAWSMANTGIYYGIRWLVGYRDTLIKLSEMVMYFYLILLKL